MRGGETQKKKKERKNRVGVVVRVNRWRAIGRNVFNCFAPSRLLFRRLCLVNGCWTPTGPRGRPRFHLWFSSFSPPRAPSSTLPTRFPPSRAFPPQTLHRGNLWFILNFYMHIVTTQSIDASLYSLLHLIRYQLVRSEYVQFYT